MHVFKKCKTTKQDIKAYQKGQIPIFKWEDTIFLFLSQSIHKLYSNVQKRGEQKAKTTGCLSQ